MGRHQVVLLVAASLLAMIAWHPHPVALANGGMPTPVPPPGSTLRPIGPFLMTAGTAWPYDFHFAHVDLTGEFFQPGEQVTITAEHISVPATTVIADANGQFNVFVDFTWQFCGPGATSEPAPVFHAAGNGGSSNTLTFPAPPCPGLIASRPPPPGGNTGGTIGGGMATALPASTAAPAPIGTAVPSTPRPWPTPAPILTSNSIAGFGFEPGEQVTIREIDAPGAAPGPITTKADAEGRFRATISVTIPGPCAGARHAPELVAVGDQGTRASTAPAYPPMPEYPCPMPAPSATVTPMPVRRASRLSLTLRPRPARRGGNERADIRAPGAGTLHLILRYPYHGGHYWTVHAGSTGRAAVRWWIPRGVHRGIASLRVTFGPGHLALRTTFLVR